MGRISLAKKNIAFGYMGQILTSLMSFILRTVFIRHLSRELLGVNATYTNVLSILSMAELGIGTALNFSLYRPVAENDREKIKSYMQLYRKAYTVIAFVVAGLGILLVPFLPHLVKNPGVSAHDLVVYYLIFLFNTVSTYFVSYKYSLVNAEQRNYIQTNINTVTKIISVGLQILVVVLTKNFLLYLLTDAAVQLLQKIFVSQYLNRLYPYLLERDVEPLSKEESKEVWTKTKALVLHRVGDVARLQTDSLIISSMIEVGVSGLVDNYTMVINTVTNFVNIIFNSVISGFGNLIATESKERQRELFGVYRFFAAWVYGFAVTGFFVLLTPFITILWGGVWAIPGACVYLILTDLYFKGERIVLSNFKTAAGVFEQDKYLALIQGAVNLVLSIFFVKRIGLAGVYVGTVVSGLIANVTKPVIIYRVCFDESAYGYFRDTVKYALTVLFCIGVSEAVCRFVMPAPKLSGFCLMFVFITVFFNGVFLLLFGRTREFAYLWGIVQGRLRKEKS